MFIISQDGLHTYDVSIFKEFSLDTRKEWTGPRAFISGGGLPTQIVYNNEYELRGESKDRDICLGLFKINPDTPVPKELSQVISDMIEGLTNKGYYKVPTQEELFNKQGVDK